MAICREERQDNIWKSSDETVWAELYFNMLWSKEAMVELTELCKLMLHTEQPNISDFTDLSFSKGTLTWANRLYTASKLLNDNPLMNSLCNEIWSYIQTTRVANPDIHDYHMEEVNIWAGRVYANLKPTWESQFDFAQFMLDYWLDQKITCENQVQALNDWAEKFEILLTCPESPDEKHGFLFTRLYRDVDSALNKNYPEEARRWNPKLQQRIRRNLRSSNNGLATAEGWGWELPADIHEWTATSQKLHCATDNPNDPISSSM